MIQTSSPTASVPLATSHQNKIPPHHLNPILPLKPISVKNESINAQQDSVTTSKFYSKKETKPELVNFSIK